MSKWTMMFDKSAADQYARDQKKWLRETGLKIGDQVRVIAKAEDYQAGWPTIWTPDMDGVAGGFVYHICGAGISILVDDGFAGGRCSDYFPFFVLVKEEHEKGK